MTQNEKRLLPIPKVGEYYHFWDDGKVAASRHFICKCEEIIPFEKVKKVNINDSISLYDIWKDEVEECDWLYDKETDYIVVCSCPKYDEDKLYFSRTVNGGWFSFNVTNFWQSGELDVDGEIYDRVINDTPEDKKSLYSDQTYD